MEMLNHIEVQTRDEERGASLVEYALLCCLIGVAALAAIRLLGTSLSSQFSSVAGQL